jgi:hypothetical protein
MIMASLPGGPDATPTPAASPTPCPTPTPAPAGPTLTDMSGNGNIGVIHGTKPLVAPDGSQVRHFNGALDYIGTANSASLNPTGGLTIEVLFNADSLNGVQTLASKSWSSGTGDGYTLWLNGDEIELILYNSNGAKTCLFSSAIEAGKWYHVAATQDGAAMSLYLNGVKTDSRSCDGLKPSALDFAIGRSAPKGEAYFKGAIALVRIYGRALSAVEVAVNYNADCARAGLPSTAGGTAGPVADGLVLWYDLSQPINETLIPDNNVTALGHPFLVFDSIESTPGYQHRYSSPWNGWEQNIIGDAGAAMSVNFQSASGPYEAQRGIYAQELGMAYQITGDAKYATKAKEALLHIGSASSLGPSGMMSMEGFRSISLLGYCFAYDWIQPALDAATDTAIRDKLAEWADTVYYECYSQGATYIPFSDHLGQSYPTLGIAGVLLSDYTNPNGLSLRSDPAEWRRVGTDYLFVDDKLHGYNRPLFDFETDPSGNDIMGSYKLYCLDDFAWWAQVYTRYYGTNFFDVYPIAKAWMTSEVWENLPNYYCNNFITNGNTVLDYHRGIVNLLDPANRSYVLHLDDTIDQSTALKYSMADQHIFYHGQMPDALLYSFFGDYSSVQRTTPSAYTSVLSKDSVFQVFRENWQEDSDWLSLITFGPDVATSSYRDTQHHDQMSFEYYAKGDLLLADAGEDRHSTDNYKGEYEVHHNTIAIEDPRSSFGTASWSGSVARGIYKGSSSGIVTPSNVKSEFTSPWMDLIDVDTTITNVIGSSAYNGDSLSSPISYERSVLYPDKDYFIVIDRMESSQPWVYRNIFRPTSLNIVPTSGSVIGHVNGDLKIGSTSYNWQSLGYKKDTDTGITANSVGWSTTNVYGNAVDLQIYTVPSSQVLTMKQIGRIGGYEQRNEVYNPVVYFREGPTTALYRATVLLPRYSNENAHTPSTIAVKGTGNALKVASSGYEDYVYTGKGNSTFASFATDADTAFIRVSGRPAEYTLINGTHLETSGQALAFMDRPIGVLSVRIDGSTLRINAPDHGPVTITLCQLDPSVRYNVEVNGVSCSSYTTGNGVVTISLQ